MLTRTRVRILIGHGPHPLALLNNRAGEWHALGGSYHLRARIYTSPFEYVSLTVTEDGRFQVVQCRRRRYVKAGDPLTEIVLIRRGRVNRASPTLELSAWPKERLAESAGLDLTKERLKLASGEWAGWNV